MSEAGESVLPLPEGHRFETLAFRLFGRPVGRHRHRIWAGHGGHRARDPCQHEWREYLDHEYSHYGQLIAEVKLPNWGEGDTGFGFGRGLCLPGSVRCLFHMSGLATRRCAKSGGQPAVISRRPMEPKGLLAEPGCRTEVYRPSGTALIT